MNYSNFLVLQLIAHLLADFIVQPGESVKEKNPKGFKKLSLLSHSLILLLLSWFFSFQWNFFLASLAITLFHNIIEGVITILVKKNKLNAPAFFIQQLIHVSIIFVVVTIFAKQYPFNPVIQFSVGTKTLLAAAAYLFCTRPANIFIKEILKAYKINIPKEGNLEIPNAGKLIGNVERILTLTLILNNQYEAVGFIIAAKSILRFRDSDTSKTEYLLIGTLLSFGFAILIGILLQSI
jgi:hypothetical protein